MGWNWPIWKIRPRQPLLGVALAAILGLFVAESFPVPVLWAWPAALLALGIVLWRPSTGACWLLTALTFGSVHLLRVQGSDARRLAENWAAGPQTIRATGIVWSAPEKPAFWSATITGQFRLKVLSLETPGGIARPNALLNVNWSGPLPAYGDRIRLFGTARNLEAPRNPGQFDFRRHLQRQGIFSELTARFPGDCLILGHGEGWPPQVFAQHAQQWIRQRLELDLKDSPDIAALIESMVLGLRGETPDDLKEMFKKTGTLHLFAVSGLNVAMLATIAWFVLKPLRLNRKVSVLLIVPLLAGYALITGLSASCLRATVMASLLLTAFLVERPAMVYNSLAAAALFILGCDTQQLFLPGFQFSFVLVVAIVALARPIQRRLETWTAPDSFLPRPLWSWRHHAQSGAGTLLAGALGVTLAAWIGSLLFTAGYFHLFSPASLLANLLAVPIAFCLLALGLGAVLCASFWTTGAIWLNNTNWLLAKALIAIVAFFAALPGGHYYVEFPFRHDGSTAELTVLDLQEGAAIHLRAQPGEWLFDCGHHSRYGTIVLPYLRSRGVNRLDGLLLSHGDAQHIGAALDVLEDFAPRQIVDSPLKDRSATRRAIHRELAARGLGKSICARGDILSLSPSARLQILYPPAGRSRSNADDQALVVRLEWGQLRVLYTSDAGFSTEQWLLENEPDLRADLLIKGQHGRDFSGTADFLARVGPQAIICAAGGRGLASAGFEGWVAQQRALGRTVFRQDECGAAEVILEQDGRFSIRGFLNGQTFRSRAR